MFWKVNNCSIVFLFIRNPEGIIYSMLGRFGEIPTNGLAHADIPVDPPFLLAFARTPFYVVVMSKLNPLRA